jgi:hypothetical protein
MWAGPIWAGVVPPRGAPRASRMFVIQEKSAESAPSHKSKLIRMGAAFRTRLLQSALPPLLIILLVPLSHPVRADGAPSSQSPALAAAALARYVASPDQVGPWSLETVEIDASLPKLEKSGRLRAIRRLLPFAKPQYQVLEVAGDRTVRQQVIVRYLSAEMEAATIPASSTAITTANYNFGYKSSLGGDTAYVFLISPKKKGPGSHQRRTVAG